MKGSSRNGHCGEDSRQDLQQQQQHESVREIDAKGSRSDEGRGGQNAEERGRSEKEKEKEEAKRGQVEKLCKARSHGPPALRPFPDADASISCSGNAARLTTHKIYIARFMSA